MNSSHLIYRAILIQRGCKFSRKKRLCTQVFSSFFAIITLRLIGIDYESWPKIKVSGSANYRGAKSSPASWRKGRGGRRSKEEEEEEEENDVTVHGATIFLKPLVSSTSSVQSSPAENTITVPDPFQQSSSLCVPFESEGKVPLLALLPTSILHHHPPTHASTGLSLSLRYPFQGSPSRKTGAGREIRKGGGGEIVVTRFVNTPFKRGSEILVRIFSLTQEGKKKRNKKTDERKKERKKEEKTKGKKETKKEKKRRK